MYSGYTLIGRATPQELVDAVGGLMNKGWLPHGAAFQAVTGEDATIKVHKRNPRLGWFQTMVNPGVLAARLDAPSEPLPGPGKQALRRGSGQALGAEEYATVGSTPFPASGKDKEPITVVAGMGRCGTSLVMAMLAAAGMPTPGATAPGYERTDVRDAIERGDYSWCEELAGGALKILGLHKFPLPPPEVWPCRVIYLRRGTIAQAKSWLEYRLRMGERDNPPPLALKKRPYDDTDWLEKERVRLDRTDTACLEYLEGCGQEFDVFWLEHLQSYPEEKAEKIIEFCRLPADALWAMAACVLPKETRGNVPG